MEQKERTNPYSLHITEAEIVVYINCPVWISTEAIGWTIDTGIGEDDATIMNKNPENEKEKILENSVDDIFVDSLELLYYFQIILVDNKHNQLLIVFIKKFKIIFKTHLIKTLFLLRKRSHVNASVEIVIFLSCFIIMIKIFKIIIDIMGMNFFNYIEKIFINKKIVLVVTKIC